MAWEAKTFEPNHADYERAVEWWNESARNEGCYKPLAGGEPVPYWTNGDRKVFRRRGDKVVPYHLKKKDEAQEAAKKAAEKKPKKKGGEKLRVAWRFRKYARPHLRPTERDMWWDLWLVAKNGVAEISVREAGGPGMSRSTAARALGRLEELGLITAMKKSRKRGVRSVYRINPFPSVNNRSVEDEQ